MLSGLGGMVMQGMALGTGNKLSRDPCSDEQKHCALHGPLSACPKHLLKQTLPSVLASTLQALPWRTAR
jgi:hypothetical protein